MPHTWPWPDPWGELPLPQIWDGDPPPMVSRARHPKGERRLAVELAEARVAFIRAFGEWMKGRAGPLGESGRGWIADADHRRFRLGRVLQAEAAVAAAIEADRRLAREAFHLQRRRAERLGGDEPATAVAFRELVLAHAGLARLPLVTTPSRHVMMLLAADGCPAELVGWPPDDPDAWEVRSNIFPALMGAQFDPGAGHVRLCRNPASWWEAGGEASAALCLLDATAASACGLVEGAETLTCDDGDHAAAVDRWLKRRRPKLPRLFVVEADAPAATDRVA